MSDKGTELSPVGAVSSEKEGRRPTLIPWPSELGKVPWWIVLLLLMGAWYVAMVFSSTTYQEAFRFIVPGVKITIMVTLAGFGLNLILGLIAGLGRVSENVIYNQISTLYVEVIRGIPLLVLILFTAFAVVPLAITLVNSIGQSLLEHVSWPPLQGLGQSLEGLSVRNVSMAARGVIGLAVGFGAYEAEVFRAGIQSIGKGQMEAARSLGMTQGQAMRHIILPQAVKNMLPPLGNDFISMLKASSLVSVLAVQELTYLGRLHRASTFNTFEAWNTVTFLYLVMTLSLSLLVGLAERRMAFEH